jgi:hypothetical protein
MVRSIGLAGLVLALIAGTVAASDHKDEHKAAAGKNPRLELLKKLAGTWVALDKDGKPTEQVVSVFKVTANGSAVQETIFPGTPHEMVTVYHLDGKDLVLTHYCAFGNQPHLKADPTAPPKKLVFKFVSGANIDPSKDDHMHEGSITVLDDNSIEWSWLAWSSGKPVEDHKVLMKLARKK